MALEQDIGQMVGGMEPSQSFWLPFDNYSTMHMLPATTYFAHSDICKSTMQYGKMAIVN